jgi:hypothetical protein
VARLPVRIGYRLADYVEVGLPVYRVMLRAFTQTRKAISPIDEFLMRLVSADIQSTGELSSFLGLPPLFVDEELSQLLVDDLLELRAGPDRRQRLAITGKGLLALQKAATIVPEERTFTVDYDAICQEIAFYGRSQLLSSRQTRLCGYKQIRPLLPKQLDTSDFSVREVQQNLRKLAPHRNSLTDVLAIRSLDRKKLYFLPAIMLIYRSIEDRDIQVSFAIEGHISEEHEQAFARSNGINSLGIDRDLARFDEMKIDVEAIVTEVTTARRVEKPQASPPSLSAQQACARVTSADLDIPQQPWSHLDPQQQRNLSDTGLCYLSAHDHPHLLRHALHRTTYRLVIISPFLHESVVNKEFVKSLDILLRREVKVFLGYGMPETHGWKAPKGQVAVVRSLEALAHKYSTFRVVKVDSHAKVLLEDEAFLALGSFNWLSFHGDPDRPFRDEQSVLITMPSMIEEKYQQLIQRFE